MWVVYGHRVHTELVAGGRETVRKCSGCSDFRLFREHREVRTATAYFVPLANYATTSLLVCTACGEQVATDELGLLASDQTGTLAGSVSGMAHRARGVLAERAASERLRQGREVFRSTASATLERTSAVLEIGRTYFEETFTAEPETSPARQEWLALLSRFEEVEPDGRTRLRLWRDRRRGGPSPVLGLLAVDEPSETDLECLRALVATGSDRDPSD